MNFSAGKQLGDRLERVCFSTQELLSAYADNSLSARQSWEIEKHLAVCKECAGVSRQMHATVTLLRGADRADTGNDFMARLHARLDEAAPVVPSRSNPADWARDLWGRARYRAGRRRVPMTALGMAGAGLAALALFVTHPIEGPSDLSGTGVSSPVLPASSVPAHENLQRNVALTANDPLGDVAAEALENADVPGAIGAPGNPASEGGVFAAPTNGS